MKTTRFIKYKEPNQEPKEHLEGKFRIHFLLGRQGYRLLSNADSWEFQLEPIKTELDGIKNYTLDVLMYNTNIRRIIAVEINGDYHYANKKRIAKTRQKMEEVIKYFSERDCIYVGGAPMPYKHYKVMAYRTDEIIGRNALHDDYITGFLC